MFDTMDDDPLTLACADKMAFDTKKQAEATALTADWQHGAQLKAYLCPHCNLWHLSSAHE
jgi:hypothetical protein